MKRTGRTLTLLAVLGALLILTAAPALAQEEMETTDAVVTGDVEGPAVEVPEDSAAEPLADWTYRYMVPTTLVLAALVVLGTSVRYFTNVVRERYRTVEE